MINSSDDAAAWALRNVRQEQSTGRGCQDRGRTVSGLPSHPVESQRHEDQDRTGRHAQRRGYGRPTRAIKLRASFEEIERRPAVTRQLYTDHEEVLFQATRP